MFKSILTAIASLAAILIISSAPVMAAPCGDCSGSNLSTKQAISCGSESASGSCQTPADAADNANGTIQKAINLLSVIGGILAVIFLIIGGMRYVTSGGASDKVGTAKNTILYALIGLVIIALAQLIVKYVIGNA